MFIDNSISSIVLRWSALLLVILMASNIVLEQAALFDNSKIIEYLDLDEKEGEEEQQEDEVEKDTFLASSKMIAALASNTTLIFAFGPHVLSDGHVLIVSPPPDGL